MSDALINPDLSSTWPVWESDRVEFNPSTQESAFNKSLRNAH
jgi:hypothetical protein